MLNVRSILSQVSQTSLIRILTCSAISFVGSFGICQETLTLSQAIELGLTKAFDIRTTKSDAQRANALVRQASSAILPQLTFDSSYTRFTDAFKVQLNPNEPPVTFRPIDRSSVQLNLSQEIDISGVSSLAISGAKDLRLSANSQVLVAANLVILNIKTNFYNVLRAERFVEVAKERLSNANDNLTVAEKRVAAGTAPRFDVLRFQTDIASARQQLTKAENDLELARAAFNASLSRDTTTPFELVPPETSETKLPALETLFQKAKATRPEIQSAKYNASYQTKYRKAQEKLALPSFRITAQWNHDPQARGFGSEKNIYSATALFSFPIYKGGQINAQVAMAKNEEEKAIILSEQTALAIELEVRQSYLDVQSAWQIIKSAEQNVELAKEVLRLAKVRYEAGVATTLEVSDSNALFVAARTEYVNAVYEYQIAIAKLQKAIGTEEI